MEWSGRCDVVVLVEGKIIFDRGTSFAGKHMAEALHGGNSEHLMNYTIGVRDI